MDERPDARSIEVGDVAPRRDGGPRLLNTDDDGVHSPGSAVLASPLGAFGDWPDVVVSGPTPD